VRKLCDDLGKQIKEAKDAAKEADLGEGEVPVKEAIGTWAQHGYDGYVCVEWEKKWHPEIEEPEVAFPQHIKVLREYLRDAGA